MEELCRDPVLAPQVLKLFNDRLQETRQALGASQKETERLQAENADLRGIIDGFESPTSRYQQLPAEGNAVCSGESCQARQAATHLEAELDNLRSQFDVLDVSRATAVQRIKELEAKLYTQETTSRELQGRLSESRGLLETRQSAFDEKETELRQKLDIVNQKYALCKARVQQLLAEKANSRGQVGPPITSTQGQASSSVQLLTPRSPIVDRNEQQHQNWFEIVKAALSNPCFPLSTPSAPQFIPPTVKALMGQGVGILSCPNRIFYPHTEGIARLIAPQAHCKGARAPLEFSGPSGELARMVGSRREVFFHAPDGICYAGTFLAVSVGTVERSVYAGFAKPYKEAIVRHTFPSKAEFLKAEKIDADRLRNYYMTGRATVEFLEPRL